MEIASTATPFRHGRLLVSTMPSYCMEVLFLTVTSIRFSAVVNSTSPLSAKRIESPGFIKSPVLAWRHTPADMISA
jgi:hypothetical protein